MWGLFKKVFGRKLISDDSAAPIQFWVNDPEIPELVKEIPANSTPSIPLKVDGYNGSGHKIGSPEWRSANCYGILVNTMNNIIPKIKKFPQKWATTKQLYVYPVAGKALNAFYDRTNLKFFYEFDPVAKKNIYAADSADIVSHELGHALLDSMRPDFWSVQSYEIWALHESFGDIVAITSVLENEDVIKHMLKETKGDLSKSNTVSKLAEQFAKILFNLTKGKGGHNPYSLRDAVNNFQYSAPENLKDDAPDNILSRECHSYSRVWTGAWYECLVEIYNDSVKNGSSPIQALSFARNIIFHYFITAVSQTPVTNRLFDSLAQKMISIDADNGSKLSVILTKVFVKRNILSTNVKSFSSKDLFVQNSAEPIKKIKISDHFDRSLILNKKLYDIEIEIPSENRVEFNKDGVVSLHAMNDFQENAKIALMCVNTLSNENLIDSLFIVEDNKLVRQKFIN
jgi:hypothetical protein